MVDNFSILLSHGLIAFALWRLLGRDDLDCETDEWGAPADSVPAQQPTGWGARDA
jgi:hypothetical protein